MVALQASALRAPVFFGSITSKMTLNPFPATFKMQILLVLYALLCIFFGPIPLYIIDSKYSTNLGICSLSVNCQVNDLL